jgi:hypothetical protein
MAAMTNHRANRELDTSNLLRMAMNSYELCSGAEPRLRSARGRVTRFARLPERGGDSNVWPPEQDVA